MFKGIISKLKAVMQKMGLVKNIKSVSGIKAIPIDDKFYQQIDMLKALYRAISVIGMISITKLSTARKKGEWLR